jgi:broad specificity phosphatase PhoE
MFDRKCKITFIRHGSTIYTEENRLYDHEDSPPLNDSGKAEIKKITEWVSRRSPRVDRIYTCSALRAVQSAKIISKEYSKDFEILEGLHSRKSGLWSGLTFEQIEEKYPNMLEEFHKNPCSYWPEGGETTIELNKRVKKVISNLIKKNIGKRIIVVTHGDVIQSAISNALQIPPKHQAKIYIPCASASQISYYAQWASLVYSGYLPL